MAGRSKVEREAMAAAGDAAAVAAAAQELHWQRLTSAARGRSALRQEVMEWVGENLLLDLEKIDGSKVPSQGAPALLKHFRNNPKEFAAKYFDKMKFNEETDSGETVLAEEGLSIEEVLVEFKRLVSEQEAIDRRGTERHDAVLLSGSQGRSGKRRLATTPFATE